MTYFPGLINLFVYSSFVFTVQCAADLFRLFEYDKAASLKSRRGGV